MTATADDAEKITFLVMTTLETPSRWSCPYFVRAASLAEAYIEVIEMNRSMFQHPRVRLEGFVVSPGELPDSKRIAKAWWTLAYQNASEENKGSSKEDFETMWDEHGATPEEEA
jgi:hypothetical protein